MPGDGLQMHQNVFGADLMLLWGTERKTRGQGNKDDTQDYKEKLQMFLHQEQE